MLIPSANSLASVNQVQSYEKMLLVGLSGIMFFCMRSRISTALSFKNALNFQYH